MEQRASVFVQDKHIGVGSLVGLCEEWVEKLVEREYCIDHAHQCVVAVVERAT